MDATPTDLDAFTVPSFSPYEAIEGLHSDDERTIVDMWSPWLARR